MQIDYLKISYEEDVYIYCLNFIKDINKIHMKQLAGRKCINK
jgi:hypothetical protein